MAICKLSEFGECDVEFTPNHWRQEFHSTTCKDRWHYLTHKAEDRKAQRQNGGSTPEELAKAKEGMDAIIKDLKAKSVQTIRRRI